ncbi:hypothetical protein G7054_g14528 [Neopestalotiopsis clavispora]|nr:hypothetical protein G7054_g14528 [Neopestalotiopsis clavispora]
MSEAAESQHLETTAETTGGKQTTSSSSTAKDTKVPAPLPSSRTGRQSSPALDIDNDLDPLNLPFNFNFEKATKKEINEYIKLLMIQNQQKDKNNEKMTDIVSGMRKQIERLEYNGASLRRNAHSQKTGLTDTTNPDKPIQSIEGKRSKSRGKTVTLLNEVDNKKKKSARSSKSRRQRSQSIFANGVDSPEESEYKHRRRTNRSNRARGTGKTARDDDPSLFSSSSSDDSDGGRPNGNRRSSTVMTAGCVLDWKYFDFSLHKENYLKGPDNWLPWKGTFMTALKSIGFVDDGSVKLTKIDELRIARYIHKTCKRDAVDLVEGIEKGTKMLKLKYNGKDPILHTTPCSSLVRQCKDAGMEISQEQQIAMFLTSTENKAHGWTKRQNTILNMNDLTIGQLKNDFTEEFKSKIGSERGANRNKNNNNNHGNDNANSHNNKSSNDNKKDKGKGKGNGKKDRKPRYDKEKGPLCYNCDEYGHIAKDCPKPPKERKNNANNLKSDKSKAVPGLEDYDKSFGHNMAATIYGHDAMKWVQIQQEYDQFMTNKEMQTSTASCPMNNDEVDDVVISPTTIDLPSNAIAYPYVHVNTTSVNTVFCANGQRRPPLLFDTGSVVNITPYADDFQDGTVMHISNRQFRVNTGGGPVYAQRIGQSKEMLVGADGEKVPVIMAKTLYIKDSPVEIMSGERWYLTGGFIQRNNLMNKLRKVMTTINVPRRGFHLWRYSDPKPQTRTGNMLITQQQDD